MKFLILFLLSFAAQAATIRTDITHPTSLPATGSFALNHVRLEYGTCDGAKFGTLKRWKIVQPDQVLVYWKDVRKRTSCIRAKWYNNRGDSSPYTLPNKVIP